MHRTSEREGSALCVPVRLRAPSGGIDCESLGAAGGVQHGAAVLLGTARAGVCQGGAGSARTQSPRVGGVPRLPRHRCRSEQLRHN